MVVKFKETFFYINKSTYMHPFFSVPLPPLLTLSLQGRHLPQGSERQAAQCRHRCLLGFPCFLLVLELWFEGLILLFSFTEIGFSASLGTLTFLLTSFGGTIFSLQSNVNFDIIKLSSLGIGVVSSWLLSEPF